jgi:integrase
LSDSPKGKCPPGCYARSGSPYWWYQFLLFGQRYRGSTGYEDAQDAADFVNTLKAKIRAEREPSKNAPVVAAITGDHYKPAPNEAMWSEALQRYHDDCVTGTDDERNALRRAGMLLARIGDIPLHELTHAKLATYRVERMKDTYRGNPITPLTANRDLGHVRQVFNYMNELGVRLPANMPVWKKLIDNAAELMHARTRHLSTEEEQRLWEAVAKVKPDLLGFLEFLLLSGQRKAAIVTLTWDQIDWQARTFKVLLKGKGKRKREHIVAITDRMLEILQAQPRVKGVDQVWTYTCRRTRYRPDGLGYIRKKGERYPLTIDGWKKDWREILDEAELEDFRVHDLRHTNATRIVMAIRDIYAAKEVLGHAQVSTTQRYTHADIEYKREALQAAEDLGRDNQRKLRESQRPPLRVVK